METSPHKKGSELLSNGEGRVIPFWQIIHIYPLDELG